MNINNLIDTCFISEDLEVLANKIKKDKLIVGIQYCKILLKLSEKNPKQTYEWYKLESERRTEIYFKIYEMKK